jgi:hypothetical protein
MRSRSVRAAGQKRVSVMRAGATIWKARFDVL